MAGPRRCLTAEDNAALIPNSNGRSRPQHRGHRSWKAIVPACPHKKRERLRTFSFFVSGQSGEAIRGAAKILFRRPLPARRDPVTAFHAYPVLPDGDRQPATRPPPLPPLPSFKIKVFGKDRGMQGGKGEPFSKKVSLPPCKQPAPAYTLKNRSRSALLTTEKEDMAMAVPAIMGESMGPPKTCSRPAATGRPSRL